MAQGDSRRTVTKPTAQRYQITPVVQIPGLVGGSGGMIEMVS
jgi:hypothetical protein